MIKNVLIHIANVEWYPVISLVLFVLVFASSLLAALSMRRTHAQAMSFLPLQDSLNEGETGHE